MSSGRRVALVVQQEVIEVFRRVLGYRGQYIEPHHHIALGIEEHDFALRLRQCKPERKRRTTAHRRGRERHVELGARRHIAPITRAFTRNDDGVAPVFLEHFENIRHLHHDLSSP